MGRFPNPSCTVLGSYFFVDIISKSCFLCKLFRGISKKAPLVLMFFIFLYGTINRFCVDEGGRNEDRHYFINVRCA